jgi:hypothetical protein
MMMTLRTIQSEPHRTTTMFMALLLLMNTTAVVHISAFSSSSSTRTSSHSRLHFATGSRGLKLYPKQRQQQPYDPRRPAQPSSAISQAQHRLPSSSSSSLSSTVLFAAKKNKNRGGGSSAEDELNRWYDEIDDDATPDKVFWDEMERQRLLLNNQDSSTSSSTESADTDDDTVTTNGIDQLQRQLVSVSESMNGGGDVPPPVSGVNGGSNLNGVGTMGSSSSSSSFSSSSSNSNSNIGPVGMKLWDQQQQQPMSFQNWRQAVPTMEQIKMADSTLSEYELFRVSDNWLDENLQREMAEMEQQQAVTMMMNDSNNNADDDDRYGNNTVMGSTRNGEMFDGGNDFMVDNNEPWQYFGEDKVVSSEDLDRLKTREVPFPIKGMYTTVGTIEQ